MDRTDDIPDEGSRGLPGLLDALNIESNDRTLGSSLWSTDSTYQLPPYVTNVSNNNTSVSPISSPSRSISRSQIGTARRTTSSGPDTNSAEADAVSNTSQFDPPSLRSIFASGQPTSSVSVNTAQASMSTASPGSSSRPFAALTNASASRRRDVRPTEISNIAGIMPQDTDFAILETEKDVDDPSAAHYNGSSDGYSANTSQALSNLFVSSDHTTPGHLSRENTTGRSLSNAVKASGDISTLTGHLLRFGFEEGRHSDITIKAFGKEYRLHKLLLDRVPYFSTAFCGPWAESSASEMNLVPDDIDPNISQIAFELAVRRIYGTIIPYREEQEAIGLFATACWLDMPDLVETCIDYILRQMHPSSLHVLIKLVTKSYYGKAGDRILSSAKAMLCRDGWEMPYEYWDDIPADVVCEIIGGDPFYVPSEWERWYLTLKLLNRRLRRISLEQGLVSSEGQLLHTPSSRVRSSAVRPSAVTNTRRRGRTYSPEDEEWISLYGHSEILPLLNLLDERIHYVHLRFEQLQLIRSQRDVLGVLLLPDKVISDALWMSMELRQKIVSASESDLELGISETTDSDSDDDDATTTPTAPSANIKGKQRTRSIDSLTSGSETASQTADLQPRRFWIPDTDVSCVMGGSREAYATATFASPSEAYASLQRTAATPEVTDSAWAADLGSSLFDTSLSAARNFVTQSLPRYSKYPPFRFCAEFPNPRTLKERKRVYSQTVWYAGSMWNLYIQRVITSKSQQLGIYLHRAKDKEPTEDPLALTVDDRIGQLEREMLMRRGERRSRHLRGDAFTSLAELEQEEAQNSYNDYEQWSPQNSSRPGNNSAGRPLKTSQSQSQPRPSAPMLMIPQTQSEHAASLPAANDTLHLSDPPLRAPSSISAIPPYTDARTTIKTYFKIYSPSKGGRLLSVYESAPDSFNFGKSWGWKSSWMVLDDGLDGGKDGLAGTGKSAGLGTGGGIGDGKLRYMVVIGNV